MLTSVNDKEAVRSGGLLWTFLKPNCIQYVLFYENQRGWTGRSVVRNAVLTVLPSTHMVDHYHL